MYSCHHNRKQTKLIGGVLKILQLNWFELFNICNISEISAVYENESLKKIVSDYKQILNMNYEPLRE